MSQIGPRPWGGVSHRRAGHKQAAQALKRGLLPAGEGTGRLSPVTPSPVILVGTDGAENLLRLRQVLIFFAEKNTRSISSRLRFLVSGSIFQPKIRAAKLIRLNNQNTPATEPNNRSDAAPITGNT